MYLLFPEKSDYRISFYHSLGESAICHIPKIYQKNYFLF